MQDNNLPVYVVLGNVGWIIPPQSQRARLVTLYVVQGECMITPELFDTVELLVDIPGRQLHAGMLGAIVEQYDDEHFEVEFANDAGKTEQLCALSSDQFIVVWQHAANAPVTTAGR